MSLFSQFSHENLEIVKSLSPQLWAAGFNELAFNDFERILRDGRVKSSVVSNVIKSVFPFKSYSQREFIFRAKRYWEAYFRKSLLSGKHPDVIHFYAQWENGNFVDVPTQSFVSDLSHLDRFAMNPRPKMPLDSHELLKIDAFGNTFCLTCEYKRARVDTNSKFNFNNITSKMRHRP
jgi:hypothetical protein